MAIKLPFTGTAVFVFFALLPISNRVCAQSIKKIVEVLASDSLNGRYAGSIYEKKARTFIENSIRKKGAKLITQPFKVDNDTSYNFYAVYKNPGCDSTVILCAHYDHLKPGSKKSKEIFRRNDIHNGADDNASGVALLIYLSHRVKQFSPKYNYLFLFTTAHEEGLHGSSYFKINKSDSLKLAIVINFDMVGRLDTGSKILSIYANFNPELNTSKKLNVKIQPYPAVLGDADVYTKTCRVLHITTGTHDDYHRSTDDANKLNYEGLYSLAKFVQRNLLR